MQRVRQSSKKEIEKVERECIQEQTRNVELKSQIGAFEDRTTLLSNTVEKLESIIYSSHSEILSMTDDLKTLHRTVATLGTDGRLAAAGVKNSSVEPNTEQEEKGDTAQASNGAPVARFPLPGAEAAQGSHTRPHIKQFLTGYCKATRAAPISEIAFGAIHKVNA